MTLLVDGEVYVAWQPESPSDVWHHVEKSLKPKNCDPFWMTRCGKSRNFVGTWELIPRRSVGYLSYCKACERTGYKSNHRLHILDSLDEIPDERMTHDGSVSDGHSGSWLEEVLG